MTRKSRIARLAFVCIALTHTAAVQADANPVVDEVAVMLAEIHAELLPVSDGSLPGYIPALETVDPDLFAISVVFADGRTVSVGDARHAFAIMSAAKPFTAALVMKQHGRDVIREKVGVEPTGYPFNSIDAIEAHPERSVNPLVNAGAMATVSLLAGANPGAQWDELLAWYRQLADAELRLDEAIYASVRDTGWRNRAIAALLYDYGRLYGEPEAVRDIYNRQSSVNVTTEDLAMMGAVLAGGGVHPVTGKRLLEPETVSAVLAVMTMAGMYDDAGEWAWEVGLPAKSGVGGGIVAVVPGRMAIAAFSPRLDEQGNSVRAQLAIRRLSGRLGLGLFGPVEQAATSRQPAAIPPAVTPEE